MIVKAVLERIINRLQVDDVEVKECFISVWTHLYSIHFAKKYVQITQKKFIHLEIFLSFYLS